MSEVIAYKGNVQGMDPVITRFTHLLNQFDARVQATPEASWSNQSPCSEWTARDVVVHVGNNVGRFCGQEIGPDDNIVTAWNLVRTDFEATAGTLDLDAEVPGPFGPMPTRDMIGRLLCNDVLVHTWDLARSVGGDERLDKDAVAGGYSGLKPMDGAIRRPGVFGDKIEPSDGDDLQTEFLKFLGRNV